MVQVRTPVVGSVIAGQSGTSGKFLVFVVTWVRECMKAVNPHAHAHAVDGESPGGFGDRMISYQGRLPARDINALDGGCSWGATAVVAAMARKLLEWWVSEGMMCSKVFGVPMIEIPATGPLVLSCRRCTL